MAGREEGGVFAEIPGFLLVAGAGGQEGGINDVAVVADAEDVFGWRQGTADGVGVEDFMGFLGVGAVGAAEGDGADRGVETGEANGIVFATPGVHDAGAAEELEL